MQDPVQSVDGRLACVCLVAENWPEMLPPKAKSFLNFMADPPTSICTVMKAPCPAVLLYLLYAHQAVDKLGAFAHAVLSISQIERSGGCVGIWMISRSLPDMNGM